MVTPNRKYLMQNPKDPARWEALEILANDPTNFYRTDLDTAGAERYGREGGFSIVPSRDYNAALSEVSEARRAKSAPPQPQEFSIPSNAAESVALLRQQGGYNGGGPAMMAELGDDRAALAGHSMREKPMPMDPELTQRIERERQRDAAGSDMSRRIAAERARDAGSGSARRPRNQELVPGTSGNRREPSIAVGRPGDAGVARLPEALRPPTDLRPTSDRSEAEGVLTRTATPTRDEEFAAAQDEANRRGLMAGLGRAGARLNEAFTGVGGDTAFYDQLAQESNSPVRQLLAQREADKRRALDDPSSEQSQRIQAWVSKALPGVYTQEEISQMTAGDADMVTRYGEMRQRLDQRAADRAAQQTLRADEISREDRIREDEQTFRATESQKDRDLQRELARRRGGGGGLGAAAAERERTRIDQQTRQLGEDFTKIDAPAFYEQFSQVDKIMRDNPNDLPGFGQLAGHLPDFATSKPGVQLRQAVGQMLAAYRKAVTGAGMSDAERAEYDRITGLVQSGDEASVREGVKLMKNAMDARIRAVAGGYRPEAVSTYGERVPSFARAVGQQGAQAPPQSSARAAPGKVRVSNGQETLEIDPADLAEAQRDGFREVT